MWRVVFSLIVILVPAGNQSSAIHGQQKLELDGVVVRYAGVGERYADAIGRTVAAARKLSIDLFEFDMPEVVEVDIRVVPDGRVRLFNDGHARLSLTLRSEMDLSQPSRSGVFHLYGLCHEIGHLAMYRPIRDHSWLSYGGAEGWAHYIGSRLVDEVYKVEGDALWPDRYDYRSDGMQRLERQLAEADQTPVVKCAGLWMQLAATVEDKNLDDLFAAWGEAKIDPAEPGVSLAAVLESQPQAAQLLDWWGKSKASLTVTRPRSGFVSDTLPTSDLGGHPVELSHDDGKQAGKKSSAGTGHAVRFDHRGNEPVYLTSIKIYGSRYGHPKPPKEDFKIWLCDSDFKQFAELKYAYAKFTRGNPKWVALKTKPTKVPKGFIVCVAFNPTATKGVFVGHDRRGTGNSSMGLPGAQLRPFANGDWMIRAEVRERDDHFALMQGGQKDPAASKARTWTDKTGKFSVVAEFVGLSGGKVRLKKADGSIVSVPLERLSSSDRKFAESLAK